jgi:hypothetical protein
MMKGADAAMLAVCDAFNLKALARPVYRTQGHVYSDPESDEEREIGNDAVTLFGVTAGSEKHLADRNEDWVGNEFCQVLADEGMGDYEDEFTRRLRDSYWVDGYTGIHWLNNPKFQEGNRAFITVFQDYCEHY